MPSLPVSSTVRLRALSIVVFLLLLVCAPAAQGASYALPLTKYGSIKLDEPNAQLFVSGAGGVAVRNLNGTTKATLGGVTNAGGMVIIGSTLYVAQCGTASIATFNTVTLAAGPAISLGAQSPQGSQGNPGRPCVLARTPGRLWFSNSDTWGEVVSVNLSTGAVQTFLSYGYYGAIIASNPVNPNQVVITDGSSSPPNIGIYDVDVATGTPTLVGTKFRDAAGSSVDDIRFTPDGASLIVASGSPYLVRKLSAATKALQVSFTTGAYPVAGAPSADGAWVVAGRSAWYDFDVYVFPAAGGTAPNRYELGAGRTLHDGGLEISSDNARVYAISYDSSEPAPILHVFDAPTVATTTLTITNPATSATGSALTVNGVLAFSGEGAVSGRDITVTATHASAGTIALGTATTNATGLWTMSVPAGTFATGGTWTLRAASAAAAPFPAKESTSTLLIGQPTSSITVAGPATTLTDGAVAFSGMLAYAPTAAATGRVVTVVATPPGSSTPQQLGTTTTYSGGGWTFNAPAGTFAGAGVWTVSVSVAANGSYPAASATRTITSQSRTTTLTLSLPATLTRGTAPSFTGTLAYSQSGTKGNRTITISATPPGGSPTVLGAATTTTTGAWTFAGAADAFDRAGLWTISASVGVVAPWPAGSAAAQLELVEPTTTTPVTASPDGTTPPVPPTTSITNNVTVVVIIVRPTRGADRLIGGLVADVIRGLTGNDVMRGGAGNDRLFGDQGNDVLFGDAGADRLDGGAGKDVLDGGLGNDVILAFDRSAGDRIRCGAGRDTVIADVRDVVARDCEKVTRRR